MRAGEANSASSSRPISGLFSRAASARSSSAAAARRRAQQVHHRDARSAPAGRRRRPGPGILERPDDRLEQRRRAAHQDQHVAGRTRGAGAGRSGRDDQACAMRFAQPDLRAGLRRVVERRVPGLISASVGLCQRPDLDQARGGVEERSCSGSAHCSVERPRERLRLREDGVDRIEHVQRRKGTNGGRQCCEVLLGAASSTLECRRMASNCAAPRPGTSRSTASRRRPRRWCAAPSARAGAGGELGDSAR